MFKEKNKKIISSPKFPCWPSVLGQVIFSLEKAWMTFLAKKPSFWSRIYALKGNEILKTVDKCPIQAQRARSGGQGNLGAQSSFVVFLMDQKAVVWYTIALNLLSTTPAPFQASFSSLFISRLMSPFSSHAPTSL